MGAMDTKTDPPEPLTASVHDGRKEYRCYTVSTTAPLPRAAGGNVPAYKGVVEVKDHDEKSNRVLWTGDACSSQLDAFERAAKWMSHWLCDTRVLR